MEKITNIEKLDKLTICFFLNRILWTFRWSTLLVPICCESKYNSVSLFYTKFVLDLLFFFFKQFHFFYTKIKVKKEGTTITDSWDKNISCVIYPWNNYPGRGSSFPRGNYAGDKSSERQFSSGEIFRGILSGGNYLWGNCLKSITRGQFSSGTIVWGHIYNTLIHTFFSNSIKIVMEYITRN